MRLKVLMAATLAFAVSAPVLAADDSDTQNAPKEKKICRTETVTGSLVSKRRICMTRQEWDKLAADTRKNIDNFANRQSGIPGAGSNPAAPQ